MHRKNWLILTSLLLALACGDDEPTKASNNSNNGTNNPVSDMGMDMAEPDMPEPDMPEPDMPEPDMPEPDMPEPDMDTDMGAITAPDPASAAEIAAIRGGTPGPIRAVAVTYTKPALGTDVAGFFVQATQTGPAIFVAVDPAQTVPVLEVGDIVGLSVDSLVDIDGITAAETISGLIVHAEGFDVSSLIQDVSFAADIVSGLNDYEAELVGALFEVVSDFANMGGGHKGADIETDGLAGNPNLEVRVPAALADAYGFERDCILTLEAGPVWRFQDRTQLSAYELTDFSDVLCPNPRLTEAFASAPNEVVLVFSRPLDPTSVLPDASQFTFDGGLMASAVTVNGNRVTLTTSAQTGGEVYIVTVANTVEDVLGAVVVAPDNEEVFEGYKTPATLRINEVNPNITSGCDLVELRVMSAGTTSGLTFHERVTEVYALPSVDVEVDDLIVLHFGTNAACLSPNIQSETSAKNEFDVATYPTNYDTAWDFYTMGSGLVSTNNVLLIYDRLGDIQDASFHVTTGATASGPTLVAAGRAGAQNAWEIVGGGQPANGYDATNFNEHAVTSDTSSDSSSSVQRVSDLDTNTKEDWSATTPASWGALNQGQSPL